MGYRTALMGDRQGFYRLVHDIETPEPRAREMLCRVEAVSLNPIDAKIIDYSPVHGVGGYDFAGTVCQLGEDVTRFKVGDKVLGFTFGLNPDNLTSGAFADLAIATEHMTCHVPELISLAEAATLPVAMGTAGYALYEKLQLPMKAQVSGESPFVLVSGGTTATGRLAIQLLKWSGFNPIATCSPSNTQVLKSLGALETFDYHSTTCGQEVKSYTKNSLSYVLDCITTADTMTMSYQAMASAGGRYVSLDPPHSHVKYTRRDITVDWVMSLSLFGKPVMLDGVYGRPATPADRHFAGEWFLLVEKLIANGVLKPPPFATRTGGLEALKEGIEEIRTGTAGGKLVYPL
ncbi:alcohol dehydrogenase GroES-like domain-containing protein [Xylariomycetidae sp. FL2044]|nr:alcohol dehydrogenase GroES-like domain-containing protein [Xylariomycetidae sp. FL2044]